jgi:hypothetical protein
LPSSLAERLLLGFLFPNCIMYRSQKTKSTSCSRVPQRVKNYLLNFLLAPALLVVFASPVAAQNTPLAPASRFTVSGYVRDARTGESLTGATVVVKELPATGTSANTYGFYSLTLPAGAYTLVAMYVGYSQQEIPVMLTSSQQLNLSLSPTAYQVQEVEIVGGQQERDRNVQSTQMGEIMLPMAQIRNLPVLFGEVDILKTIQLLPGVQSGGEGNTGFYVRGGGADQNLVLLDEAVVYNPGHLFNFFSVFNGDAIRNTTLIKGNMPARYGGRLSSVLDISMKEGNNQQFQAEGGIGLIASRLTLQGPIVKEKASFMVSGRRTYLDQVAGPFLRNTSQGGVPYYFYDLNAKVNYTLSNRDRLFLSGYFGRDEGSFTLPSGRLKADFGWGNSTATARWNHLFNDRLFMNVSAIYNDYNFTFDVDFENLTSRLETGVNDYNAKVDFDYFPSVKHHIQYGANYTFHKLRPRNGQAQSAEGEVFSTDRVLEKYAHETALYLSDDWALTDRLSVHLGLRASRFDQVGPFTGYTFSSNGAIADSMTYGRGERVRSFWALEPRFSARYTLNAASSVKAGITRTAQYLHLVSNSYTALPLDIWVPSSRLVLPQLGLQYAAGYFRNLSDNQYEASVEVYYKDLQNQLEFGESYAPGPMNRDLEFEFVRGRGWSYGLEFFLRKNAGDLQGWIGYTLSRTTRQFAELNEGRPFPARFDRRHDISAVATYTLTDRWTLGSTFVYGTGQAITMPERRYLIEGTVTYQYGDRNSFRMEPFHRLDFSATLKNKPKSDRKIKSSWTFAVYNAYSRRNPFFYYIDAEGDLFADDLRLQAKKVALIPFPVPSVTWNFLW